MTRGQALIETLAILFVLMAVGLGGTWLSLQQFAKLLLTRGAAKHSRCVAETEDPQSCAGLLQNELKKYFAFKEIHISERRLQGVIQTTIEARFLNQSPIHAQFDLQPSEYKRVPQ